MSHTNVRAPVARRDWTQGSVAGNLLSLSWPMVIHNGLYMLGQTVDMVWIGRLGSAAVAGVGVAFSVHMLVLSAKMGLVAGTRAMVARAVGSGDVAGASESARQAFILSIIYGVVLSILGITLARPVMDLFGVKPEVVEYGVAYMRVLFGGWVFYSLWLMAFSIMQAAGDPLTPMWIHGITRAVQLVLSPLLVFGLLGFPELGVGGAALAMITGQALGMFISLWLLFTGRTRLRLTLKGFRIQPQLIWRMVKIGLPASVMGMERNFGLTILTKVIAPFGTLAVAAHTLNNRVEMMVQMPSMGIGQGAAVLVGQNLGARQPGRAERTGWLAAGMLECFMTACAIAALLWAEVIMGIFTRDPELLSMASTFLRIAAAGYLINGMSAALQNSVSGAGDTLPPMLFSIVSTWGILLPLAFVLPGIGDWGVYGIRWAMVASLGFGAIVYTIYFKLGRWKRKMV